MKKVQILLVKLIFAYGSDKNIKTNLQQKDRAIP
jgi:hypothetical protein